MTIHQFPNHRTRAYMHDLIRWKSQGRIKRYHMDEAMAAEMRKYHLKHMYLADCKLTLLEPATTPVGVFDRVLIQGRGSEHERCPGCGGMAASYLTEEMTVCCTVCGTVYKRRLDADETARG